MSGTTADAASAARPKWLNRQADERQAGAADHATKAGKAGIEMPNRTLIVLLSCVGMVIVWTIMQFGLPVPMGLQQSGTAFSVGDHSVVITYGYFGNGDKLAFAIVQTWPVGTSSEQMLADRRVDFSTGAAPLIRHNDGRYYPPDMSGTVYMFFDDELRTMNVQMDEHTDTVGLMHAKDIDGIWSHFEKYRSQPE